MIISQESVAGFLTTHPPASLIVCLDRILVASVGRPWTLTRPGLRGARLTSAPDAIQVSGQVGELSVEINFRAENDRLRADLRWHNDGTQTLTDVAVGLVVPLELDRPRVTIPQVIYNDNPSADTDRPVPHVGRGGFVTEEHRLPIPAVTVESGGRQMTVISRPDPARDDNGRVHYGSMGAIMDDNRVQIVAMSGVTLFDGQPDVTYVHKARTAPTDSGYRDLAPGEAVTGSYLLDSGPVTEPGTGFRALARIGDQVFRPTGSRPLDRDQLIDLKVAALDARWDAEVTGYLKFPAWGEPRGRPGRPDRDLLYGWTGQCLRLAWCDARVGLERGERHRVERARAAVEFYRRGSSTGRSGLRYNSYIDDHDRPDRGWQGFVRGGERMISSRAHGETLCDVGDLVLLFREHGLEVPEGWVDLVVEGAAFISTALLPSGLVPIGWTDDGEPLAADPGASGIPAVEALTKAYAVTDDQVWLDHAVELAEHYHSQHTLTFDRPFDHSTLDAACEDKEGGLAYFRMVVDLWRLTGHDRFRDRAEIVADWLLTWVYHWSPEFDLDAPLTARGFSATGWPGVSVQNHHLDVFFPTYELWWLGRETGNAHYQAMAEMIMDAMGQGICREPGDWDFDVVGEQAEAFFVTAWQDRGRSNTWNPSWVIALPLWHALRMPR